MSQEEQAVKTAQDPRRGGGAWLEGRKGRWPGEAERAWGMKVQDQRQGGGEETSPASSESCKTEPGTEPAHPRRNSLEASVDSNNHLFSPSATGPLVKLEVDMRVTTPVSTRLGPSFK
ncbi:Cytoplasmic Dynein 2 Intermediate Chain 2 [Manis pentadactyla]|nr:Cytoplasmic Dynein 2 Intermediate Chain 2 [Manis pentadactyla]